MRSTDGEAAGGSPDAHQVATAPSGGDLARPWPRAVTRPDLSARRRAGAADAALRRRGPARPRAEARSTRSSPRQAPRLDASAPTSRRWSRRSPTCSRGGKRLRPAFCYWGWRGAGGADSEDGRPAAASLELLQACALDPRRRHGRPDTRRGQPAAHRRFAPLHRGGRLAGLAGGVRRAARRSCSATCACPGPTSCSRGSGLAADALPRGRAGLDVMRTELMAGQYLDLLEQAAGGGSVDAAPARSSATRPRSTPIERPLHLGAALAGAGAGLLAAYSALRPAARRGVPAARRRPRRVRRPGGDRQAGRRRPARGQADGARRARRSSRRRRRRPRCCAASSATPRSTRPASTRCARSSSDTGALAERRAR